MTRISVRRTLAAATLAAVLSWVPLSTAEAFFGFGQTRQEEAVAESRSPQAGFFVTVWKFLQAMWGGAGSQLSSND